MSPDTIYAPLTPPGKSAIAVVRVSGPRSSEILTTLTRSKRALEQPRKLILASVFDTSLGSSADEEVVLDQALVAFFPGPKNFTGEDLFELQLHGSPYILRKLSENLSALGIRLAKPGEFTERAFLNGRIDLVQAEAVGDIIAAETAAQARVAEQQLSGKLSSALTQLGEPLRDMLSLVEAYIDFPDEDIDPGSLASWKRELEGIASSVDRYIKSYRSGRLHRSGAKVVLAGLPNAGKSSLLNRLVGENRAIVTPTAGTTRDSIDVVLELGGLRISIWDTAGLEIHGSREVGEVEQLGIERAEQHIREADLLLFLVSPDLDLAQQFKRFVDLGLGAKSTLLVLSKSDSIDRSLVTQLKQQIREATSYIPLAISSESGAGVEELEHSILSELLGANVDPSQQLICNERHFIALGTAADAVQSSLDRLRDTEFSAELLAFEIRTALSALSDIVGVTSTEDILGRIFSKFCIGK